MLMMINTDVSRRRRQFYKRALTLSSIPPQLIPEVENETDEDEQSKLLKSPRHTAEKNTVVSDDGNSGTKTTILTEGADAPEGPAKHKRALFTQRRSITISTDEPLLPIKDHNSGKRSPFSKSPTSPSAILAKFKERIQQSLFITSTEWSSASAILSERRQKANEHAKATLHEKDLDIESIQLMELAKKRKRCRRSDTVGHAPEGESIEDTDRLRRCRMKSDPVVYSTQKENNPINDDTLPPELDSKNRDAARDAFRRRSISEDTYDRLPPSYLKERKQLQASHGISCMESDMASSKSSNSGGIVCSNEDLQEILTCYKREKSPIPVIAPSRTISVDVSKHPRHSYTTQSSYTPSYLSQCSVSSTVSGKSETTETICDNLSRVHSRLGSTSSSIHVYPEVILDSCKGQATIGPLDLNNPDGFEIDEAEKANYDDEKDNEGYQQPPEVVYDEYGQTWEVYGAEIDPEILGSAIQKHLVKLMNTKNGEQYVSQPTSSSNQSVQQEHESTSKAFLSWWRFLCLFGTSKQHESTVC